jgi:hypothetical protein
MPELETATGELLAQGFHSYVDALAAIRSFKSEVVKGCRAVMEEGLLRLPKSLNTSGTKTGIVEEIDPFDIDDFGEDYAWIGVSLPLVPEKLWFSVGIYLDQTDESTQRVQAYVSFYTARKDIAKMLFGALGELRGTAFVLDDEDSGVCAVEPILNNALVSYREILRKAMSSWLDTDNGKALIILGKVVNPR